MVTKSALTLQRRLQWRRHGGRGRRAGGCVPPTCPKDWFLDSSKSDKKLVRRGGDTTLLLLLCSSLQFFLSLHVIVVEISHVFDDCRPITVLQQRLSAARLCAPISLLSYRPLMTDLSRVLIHSRCQWTNCATGKPNERM